MHDTLPFATAYFFLGFFICGPQMLTGMAAAKVCHKDYAGTATGFVGLFGYMGAALTGLPLSFIIRGYGWEAFYMVMLVASVFSAIILPLLTVKKSAAHGINLL